MAFPDLVTENLTDKLLLACRPSNSGTSDNSFLRPLSNTFIQTLSTSADSLQSTNSLQFSDSQQSTDYQLSTGSQLSTDLQHFITSSNGVSISKTFQVPTKNPDEFTFNPEIILKYYTPSTYLISLSCFDCSQHFKSHDLFWPHCLKCHNFLCFKAILKSPDEAERIENLPQVTTRNFLEPSRTKISCKTSSAPKLGKIDKFLDIYKQTFDN